MYHWLLNTESTEESQASFYSNGLFFSALGGYLMGEVCNRNQQRHGEQ